MHWSKKTYSENISPHCGTITLRIYVQRVVKTLVTTTKGTRISDLHTSLKYGFCKKLHRYNSKTSQKVRKKMFNWSEVHLYRSNFLQNPYFSTLRFLLYVLVLLYVLFEIFWPHCSGYLLNMDFVRSYFGTNEPLNSWTLLSSLSFQISTRSVLIWKKSEDKSVQLVRGSFVPK